MLSETKIGSLSFGTFTFNSFFNEPTCRDAVRQILAFANRSPLSSFGEIDSDIGECFVGEQSSRGIYFALLIGTAAISFPTSEQWRNSTISVHIQELGKEAAIVDRSDLAPNMSLPEHVNTHFDLISGFRDLDVFDGGEVWSKRSDWFPSLDFLTRVEGDLRSLKTNSLQLMQVVNRLFEIECAIASWDPQIGLPEWKSKVTSEGEQRRHYCQFNSSAGQSEVYDWHARFTPGAGRIHFRMVPNARRAEVAYIGPKLGA
ncbi:hypothetical protein [Dokdonella immobilis]|uniref:hypothetical protein n=1 Tax=Dokdonella immobilis TaxID=578942 RepID=UPI00111349FD|nr:hypothetical protein [Dokdonella immobilis]